MKCTGCGGLMAADVDVSGGCCGHEDGEYCYCDAPDVTVQMRCKTRKTAKCSRGDVLVISDKYALERYFTAYYVAGQGPAVR